MDRIIDSHAHVLSADMDRYPTRSLDPSVCERFLADPITVERLLEALDENGVEQALLVQRGQIYGFDNSYVCDAAEQAVGRLHPVVGIDATRPDCVATARQWLQRGAVGLRLMEQRRGDALDWLLGEHAQLLWRFAADNALPVCVHFFPWSRREGLSRLSALIGEYRDFPLVIDHLSNPPLSEDCQDPDDLICRYADFQNVFLKFTAIPLAQLKANAVPAVGVLRRFVARFGADRIMWGSDIAQTDGSYADLLQLALDATTGLPPVEQAMLLGGTAAYVYRLDPRKARRRATAAGVAGSSQAAAVRTESAS